MADKSTKGRSKLLKGGRAGKQFGGPFARPLARPGVAPVRPLARPVARPLGVATPGRRFGVKHGGKSKK